MKKRYLLITITFFNLFFSQQKEEYFIDYTSNKKFLKSKTIYSNDLIKKGLVDTKSYYNFINNRQTIQLSYTKTTKKYIDKYLSYKWLPSIYGLLDFYEPLFELKLQEYNLPKELKYLAIVESNLNPTVSSSVGASGLWQFMPKTGKEYGLGKTRYVNFFYDPYTETDSACRYLKHLYSILKDWNLVLSAYNWGIGRVLKLIKTHKTKNYWYLRQFMPKETQAYAPSFHAVKYIGEAYNLYYKTKPVLKYDYTSVIEISTKSKTNFKVLSQYTGINIETLKFLNPHIVTEIIPKNCFIYSLKRKDY